ncbi:hypothetical protein [Sorangium sp. So ce861]|uniref:hypothetical protein n=1 Tax=Sorangium sp. So ce861 TaxID=3133323 RepID=UPI003F63D69C
METTNLDVRSEREIVITRTFAAPRRIVFDAMTNHERDGKTTLTSRIVYRSQADRDAHLQPGMGGGMRETFNRLAELLPTLASS